MGRVQMGVGFLLMLVITLAGATTARAGDDRIIYTCSTYSDPYTNPTDICETDPDSSATPVNLTNTPDYSEEYPVFSPDGSKFAFSVAYEGGLADLYVADSDNPDSAINLSNSPGCQEWYPVASWSPDSSSIAYSTHLCSSAPADRVYTVSASGTTDPVRFGPEGQAGGVPAWSPDGTRIAYSSAGGIWVGPADGSSPPSLLANSSGGSSPKWSPDGSKILMIVSGANDALKVINANGTGTPLTLYTSDRIMDGNRVAWSPDGTKVAWNFLAGSVHVNSSSDPDDGIDLPNDVNVSGADLSFSPDGKRLLYAAIPSPPNSPSLVRLYTQPVDGSEGPSAITDPLIQAMEPSWLPRDVGPTGPTGPTNPTGPTGPTGPTKPTKTPKTVFFINLQHVVTVSGSGYVPPLKVGINCNAEGGLGTNPYCQINGQGTASTAVVFHARSPLGPTHSLRKAKKKTVVVVKGSLKVKAGKKGTLKLKFTKAGRKLIKKGRNLKLKVTIKNTRKGQKVQTKRTTVKLKVKKG